MKHFSLRRILYAFLLMSAGGAITGYIKSPKPIEPHRWMMTVAATLFFVYRNAERDKQ